MPERVRGRAGGGAGEKALESLITADNALPSRCKERNMISADLGKQLEDVVAGWVESGRYNSKSEVLRGGVGLIHGGETRLAALDASIARGWADADAGRTRPANEVFERLAR